MPIQSGSFLSRALFLCFIAFLAILVGAASSVFPAFYAIAFFVVVAGGLIVFIDHRAGIWLLVFLMPFAATYLIPRQVFGITGLNPVNALLAVTLGSLLLAKAFGSRRLDLVALPRALLVYLVLLALAAVFGSFHAVKAIPLVNAQGEYETLSRTKYLLDNFFKPLVILIVAWLAAVLARNGGGRSLVFAVAMAALILNVVLLAYLVWAGISLDVLASSRARGFLSWMGMHANELGLMANMMLACLMFTALGSPVLRDRTVLLAAAGCAALTAALTFSRGAFLGTLVIGAYFLLTRRRFLQFGAGVLAVVIVALFLPDAFIERATTGFQRADIGMITAGRYDSIWLPLWPTVLDNPLFGHGLSSTLWAAPNLRGAMLPVGHPHSAYLGVLLDFGLVGAVVILVFFVFMWRLFSRLQREHPEQFWRGVFEGGKVCLLLLLVQGLTDDRFVPTYPQSILWLVFGLAIGKSAALMRAPEPKA